MNKNEFSETLDQKIYDCMCDMVKEMKNYIEQNNISLAYQWPITPKYKVVPHDMYGMREKNYNTYKPRFHSGFDITADVGTPVKSMLPGYVVFTGIDEVKDKNGQPMFNTKYGKKIEILQADGNIACYGHLSEINVKEGDFVDYDDIIALTGCSGGSRVPHLHFEIRKGIQKKGNENTTYNPLEILPDIGIENIQTRYTTKPFSDLWDIMNSNNPFGFEPGDIWWETDKELIR